MKSESEAVEKPLYAVILLPSTSYAIRGEKLLKQEGLSCRLIPVPRHISSDCGSCIRVQRADLQRAEEIIREKGISMEGSVEV